MHVICPSCRQSVEFSGARPKFCGQCGQAIGDHDPSVAAACVAETATLPPSPLFAAQTLSFAAPVNGESEETAPMSSPAGTGDALPESVGPYRLVRRLGGGGMGTVYEATDPISGRSVALKLVQHDHAATGEAFERFRQEGELASKLAHPRCVFVLASGEDRGRPFIIMELMTGSTLADLVKSGGPLPVPQALGKILDVIDGLQEAHQLGLIHRDVKPSNCFLEADGRVKIGDFGLAKSLMREADLTRTGTFLGTPLYAAPEQIKMEKVDAQSDVYSVAATLYFLLTGRAPFQSGDPMATMARIVADDAPPMRTLRPELPKALDRIVLRGLERDRKRRWRTLEDFRGALRPFQPTAPSVGGLGLRLAAHLVDWVGLALVSAGWSVLLGGFVAEFAGKLVGAGLALSVTMFFAEIPSLAYFGLLEGLWGRSLGKQLFRLRVGTIHSIRTPGIGRALLRAGVLYLLFNAPNLVFVPLLTMSLLETSPEGSPPVQKPWALHTITFLQLIIWPYVAVGLMVCTMRKRNGFRGLHEFLSGTRTYRLGWPQTKKRRALKIPEFFADLGHPAGLPEQVGTYQIRGAVLWTPSEQILLGNDEKLGRAVWVWIRPASQPAMAEAERNVDRTTRMRWVAGGTLSGQQWDAFLAPAGCPLPAIVAHDRRLTWAEFRGILEELTEEMRCSCDDGSLPVTLTPDQIWIGRGGRMQLLGVPYARAALPDEPATNPPDAALDDQQRALSFIGNVSITALEGRARPDGSPPARIHAPLPLYAAQLLSRLWPQPDGSTRANKKQKAPSLQTFDRVDGFQADLLAVQTEPAEVTRQMRAKHLFWQAVFLWSGFIICGMAVWLLSPIPGYEGQVEPIELLVLSVSMSLLPALMMRGGPSFVVSGIALVRADGRRASRLRCLWRSVLAWTFFTLFVAIIALSVAGITFCSPWITPILGERGPQICQIGVAVAFLAGFVSLLLRNPRRAPHDRLAGTYLVPK